MLRKRGDQSTNEAQTKTAVVHLRNNIVKMFMRSTTHGKGTPHTEMSLVLILTVYNIYRED